MNSIQKGIGYIKRKLRYIPFDIFVAVLICLVAFAAFALGWIAHSQHQPHEVQMQRIPLTASTNELYVGSINSDKVHYRWCSGADRIQANNRIYFSSLSEARAKGYTPAQNCPGMETY